MSVESFRPAIIEEFRGRWSASGVNTETPPGYASDETNVDFAPGRVFKRPGLVSTAIIADDVAINSAAAFGTNIDGFYSVLLTQVGKLVRVAIDFFDTDIEDGIVTPSADASMHAASLFRRLFMAFGHRYLEGREMPRHYDGALLDQVGQEGPGAAPSVAAGAAGNILGTHLCRVFFKTRSGYWTAPGPPVSFTFATAAKADVTGIAIGPPNIVARVLVFTPRDSADYFFIPSTSMEINDNTTTSVTGVDFLDSSLISATAVSSSSDPADDLMRQIELPPQSGVVAYKRRLAWWGGVNALLKNGDDGFLNLSFDGGFNVNVPLGWTEVASGQSKTTVAGATGNVLKVTGDGTNQKGRLQNNSLAFGFLDPGRPIEAWVRVKLDPAAPPAAGTLHVFWTGTGAPATAADFNVTSLSSTEWRWVRATLLSAADNKPQSDWKLNFTTGGTGYGGTALTAATSIFVDRIMPVYSDNDLQGSLVRWSKVDDPEAYDGLEGIMNVAESDGQSIRAAFVLRDNLYFAKEHSLFVTRDNVSTEPNNWQVDEVSSAYGAFGPKAVGLGDGWAILANRAGIYYFAGGQLIELSSEIKPDWDLLVQDSSWKVWCEVDPEEKVIYVGFPSITGAITKIFYCRYDGETPISGRHDWSIWTSAASVSGFDANCAVMNETNQGIRQLYLGHGPLLGAKLSHFDVDTMNDFTHTAILSYYTTAFIGGASQRTLVGYITMNVRGIGGLLLEAISPTGVIKVIRSVVLQDPFNSDVERITRVVGERNAFKFGTIHLDTKWSMQKFVPYIKLKPGSPVRGYGADT
jgi:hypothetical protein